MTPKTPTSERAQEFRERLRKLEWREVAGRPATAEELANAAAHVFEEMESGAVSEWREISTAPKDGHDVLVVTEVGLVRIAFWDEQRGGRWSIWPGRESTIPTHWRTLPASPASGEGKGE